ncbi:MAG TPA: hypothetical protein VK886_15635 [Vicinamibacterales bacterium]|nr:hypothetical protein [Vicinamibacterales bacterium]
MGRVARGVLAATATLIVLAAVLAAARRASPMFPVSDEAVTEIYTLHALRGQQLTGPYSRFAWHHPGPAYFYFLVPFYVAAGRLTAGLNAGALLSNVLMVIATGWCFLRHREYAMLASFAVLTFLYISRLGDMTASAWNPHVAVIPVAAVVVVSAAVAGGDHALLPVAVAIGSYAVQTHLAVAPAAALSTPLAFAVALARRRTRDETERRRVTRWLWCGALTGAAFWALPAIDAIVNRGGNLGALLKFFSQPSSAIQPPSTAVAVWADLMSGVARLDLQMPAGFPVRPSGGRLPMLIAVVELAALGGILFWSRRTARSSRFWLAIVALLASIAALAALARIPEELTDHQVFWISALGLVDATIILGVALSFAGRTVELRPRAQPYAAAAALVALAVVVLNPGLAAMARVGTRSRHPAEDERFVRATTAVVREAFNRGEIRRLLVHVEPATWHITAGVVLQLYKAGLPCAVDAAVGMYGRQFRPHGSEDSAIAVLDAEGHRRLAARRGRVTIFERNGWFVDAWPLEAQPASR